MGILITGFEPFGGDAKNAAWEAVRRLPDTLAGVQLVKRQLPVSFSAVWPALEREIAACAPELVLCVGQAAGRTALTPEKVAINWNTSTRPDNDGRICAGEPICPDGPAAYFSTLPVEAMAEAIRAANIPAQVSYTAGTYVCNCTMYALLHHLRGTERRGGFLHVPNLCEQTLEKPAPSLPVETVELGLEQALRAAL